jgi:SAM-dependent methyltransferase
MTNDFSEAAAYYDRVFASRGKNYEAEARAVVGIIRSHVPAAARLLDVACGTAAHLAFFAREFAASGIDRDASMLEIARVRCPGVAFHEGDMRDFALHATFDAIVCMFGSIAYLDGPRELEATLRSMRAHLAPGAIAVIEPFVSPQNYKTGDLAMVVVDEPDIKISRVHVSGRSGDLAILDHHFLVADASGARHFVERHELYLFDDDTIHGAFSAAGFRSAHVARDPFRNGLFVGVAM